MPTPLLVITSDIPFGEHLRRSLEETGRFVVGVTREQEDALAYAEEFKPALAFLDTSLVEHKLMSIGALLRQADPDIHFVVISEAGWHTALEELFPREYLSRPFSMHDLLDVISRYLPGSNTPGTAHQPEETPNSDLPWLTDVSRAAQHLTRLTLESSAQAALITRTDKLWAYAGQLPQPAASELAEVLGRYWDHQEENDLVRFVRLVSTNAEHMLYATRLADGMVLALVFDAETPFSTIRTQASQLVHSLSTSPSDTREEDDPGKPSISNPLSSFPTPEPLVKFPSPARDGGGKGINRTSQVPAWQNRQGSGYPSEGQYKPLVDTDQGEALVEPLEDSPRTARNQRMTSPEVFHDTRMTAVPDGTHKIVLEPISAALYNLDYACVLVPRFPQHHITGDLMDRLGEWVAQLCIAYSWRLEYISVRPDYLQWIVNVPPVTAPAYLMRVLRQHTSEMIFAEFPRFKKENPSGEFWASGYLMMGGSQPAPAQLIKDFIAQTRQRQGIPPPPNQ